MKARTFRLWFLLIILASVHSQFAQEKKVFLQQRFDGFTEIIDKGYTQAKLDALSDEFSKVGISCTFDALVYNTKKELTSILITIRNKNNKASLKIVKNNKPIPSIRVGELDGRVYIEAAKRRHPLIKEH